MSKNPRMEILKELREKKEIFFKGKHQDSLFTYPSYWPKVEKWELIDTIEEIVDITQINFNIGKLKELWEKRQWNKEDENKKMQEMYNKFKNLLMKKIEELRTPRTPEKHGEQMWRLTKWFVKKNMLVREENGYTPILEVKKETPKAFLVISKMQLNTTTKEQEVWIPKSQIEEKLPILN
jgi:hypothetical protein